MLTMKRFILNEEIFISIELHAIEISFVRIFSWQNPDHFKLKQSQIKAIHFKQTD